MACARRSVAALNGVSSADGHMTGKVVVTGFWVGSRVRAPRDGTPLADVPVPSTDGLLSD